MASSYSPYENQPAVIDLGSHSLRFGYSGESKPLRTIPSVVGIASTQDLLKKEKQNNFNNSNIIYPLNPMEKRDHMDLIYYIQPNVSVSESGVCRTKTHSYSLLEKILDATMGVKGLNDPLSDHPILITEPNRTDTQYRENVLETLFESFQVPSALLCKTAPLMCYAVARTSGVVLDIGASGTDTCFVSEGYVVPKSIIETPIGGDFIDQWLLNTLQEKYKVLPFYTKNSTLNDSIQTPLDLLKMSQTNPPFLTPFVSSSYDQWCKQYVSSCIKENLEDFTQNNTTLYLPDGKPIESNDLSDISKVINEFLFTPSILKDRKSSISCYYQNPMALSVTQFVSRENKNTTLLKKANTLSSKPPPPSSFLSNQIHSHPTTDLSNFLRGFTGVSNQIYSSLEASEKQTHNITVDGLVVGGGSSLLPGFMQRLQQDITSNKQLRHLPTPLSICASISPKERQYSAWIGGSIISCLGSFSQFCISFEEYNEMGAISAAEKKCP